MNIQVLFSAMFQTDDGLPLRANVHKDYVVINQTSFTSHPDIKYQNGQDVFISVEERGLSNSRNQAIRQASAEVCLLADDDLVYYDNFKELVRDAYITYPEADIILFDFDEPDNLRKRNKPQKKSGRLGYLGLLRGNSVRISFLRDRIIKSGITFNPQFGAGSSMFTSGEDIVFLSDAFRKGLKVYYYDKKILKLLPEEDLDSTWFKGYNKQYYINIGAFARHYAGAFLAWLYIAQFLLRHLRQGELPLKQRWKYACAGLKIYARSLKRLSSS